MRYLSTIIFAFFFLPSGWGQTGKLFRRYSVEHGLSNSLVNAMGMDAQRYLWLGTDDGLNRFDGSQFKTYRFDAEDSTSISANIIYSIFQDSQGRLWVGTASGLNLYQAEGDYFESFFLQKGQK